MKFIFKRKPRIIFSYIFSQSLIVEESFVFFFLLLYFQYKDSGCLSHQLRKIDFKSIKRSAVDEVRPLDSESPSKSQVMDLINLLIHLTFHQLFLLLNRLLLSNIIYLPSWITTSARRKFTRALSSSEFMSRKLLSPFRFST